MAKLNYKKELRVLENDIASTTLKENKEVVELIAANLNSLYGLLLCLHGPQGNIFPISTVERSKKFLVMTYSMSAFQISSSITDLTLSGKYTEASVLMRSLIESVAFAEYYYLNPLTPSLLKGDARKLPSRQTVFKYLKKQGKIPLGGPQKSYSRYNDSAHAEIASVLLHWAEANSDTKTSSFWIRRYLHDSFYGLMRDLVIPLIAIKQIFKSTFESEISAYEDKSWSQYWAVGQDREKITRLFPEIHLGRL